MTPHDGQASLPEPVRWLSGWAGALASAAHPRPGDDPTGQDPGEVLLAAVDIPRHRTIGDWISS